MSTTEEAKPEGWFDRAADHLSFTIGQPWAFMTAAAVVIVWACLGPLASFSNTWQLIINTGTTIVTFLMVFLLGNASNRITENQDRMLENIFREESRLASEERMMEKLLDRIDIRHIRPILKHLDAQDDELRAISERILAAVRK